MKQKCALEKQILPLSLASMAPDGLAYKLMKGPGYTVVTIGK